MVPSAKAVVSAWLVKASAVNVSSKQVRPLLSPLLPFNLQMAPTFFIPGMVDYPESLIDPSYKGQI